MRVMVMEMELLILRYLLLGVLGMDLVVVPKDLERWIRLEMLALGVKGNTFIWI